MTIIGNTMKILKYENKKILKCLSSLAYFYLVVQIFAENTGKLIILFQLFKISTEITLLCYT